MSVEDINDSFDSAFPAEALPEVLNYASLAKRRHAGHPGIAGSFGAQRR